MKSKKPGLIVCGTDTNVGKTIVSALLVQGLNGTYWKPVQSGLNDNGDTGVVKKLLGLSNDRLIEEEYRFKTPVSPHWAAEKENRVVNPDRLKLPLTNNFLIVETAGGLLVPLNRSLLQIEQIKEWQLPVLLVARTVLGTLNHTFLSIEALRNRDIPILGIFLNGEPHEDNPRTIEEISNVPILGHLPPIEKMNAKALSEEWQKQKLDNRFKTII